MRRIFYIFFLIVFSRSYPMQSIEWLRGTHKSFSESHKGWSPLAGASLWGSGWIKGLYTYGDITHGMVQLVHQLFHDSVGDICPSKSLHNPPFRIMQQGLFSQMIKMMDADLINDESVKNKFIEQLTAGYDRFVVESEGVSDCKKLAKKMRRLRNQTINFLDLIKKAIEEERRGLYPVHTIEQIFSAYWFSLLQKESDIQSHIASYMSYFDLPYDHDHAYDATELQETQRLIATGSSEDITDLLQDVEKLSVARLSEIMSPEGFPPLILYDSYNYGSFVEKAPHCVETMFFNLFNFLLYDAEHQLYDTDLIPSMHERVQSFYKNVNDDGSSRLISAHTNFPETKKAWMNAMSNIQEEDISYKMHDQYVMISNLPNVIRICNVLFNAHITHLVELGAFLSHQMHDRTIKVKEVSSTCYEISLHEKTSGNVRRMILHIRDWHSWCEYVTPKNEPRDVLVKSLDDSFEHQQLKLCVDNPLPSAQQLSLLEYIMYSKSLDNEDLITAYILMMVDRIKAEGSFERNASRLLRWMFKIDSEETPPVNNMKIRHALSGITDEATLQKFLNYFDEHRRDLRTSEEEVLCAHKFSL